MMVAKFNEYMAGRHFLDWQTHKFKTLWPINFCFLFIKIMLLQQILHNLI